MKLNKLLQTHYTFPGNSLKIGGFMKLFSLVALLPILAFATPQSIEKQIRRNNPLIAKAHSRKIASAIHMTSIKYKIKPKLLTAILKQESNYKTDAANCRRYSCYDFGISQINWITAKAYNLSLVRLMSDPEYAIDAAGRILADLKKSHGKDPLYWTRYNAVSPDKRLAYYNRVKRWM